MLLNCPHHRQKGERIFKYFEPKNEFSLRKNCASAIFKEPFPQYIKSREIAILAQRSQAICFDLSRLFNFNFGNYHSEARSSRHLDIYFSSQNGE